MPVINAIRTGEMITKFQKAAAYGKGSAGNIRVWNPECHLQMEERRFRPNRRQFDHIGCCVWMQSG